MKKAFKIITLLMIMLMCFSVIASAVNDGESETQQQEVQTDAQNTQSDASPSETQQSDADQTSVQADNRSSNANLSSLDVVGKTETGESVSVTLSPEFKSGTRTYTASVPFEVVRLEITVSAADSKAKINIPEGYLTLDVGANKSFVYVTAENGVRRTYQINTQRAEQAETAAEEQTTVPETAIETQPVTEAAATVPIEEQAAVPGEDAGLNKYIKLGIVFGVSGILLVAIAVAVLVKKRGMSEVD